MFLNVQTKRGHSIPIHLHNKDINLLEIIKQTLL